MIIRGMNLSLIIACIIIILALIIFPLIVSHKAEKHDSLKSVDKDKLSEWENNFSQSLIEKLDKFDEHILLSTKQYEVLKKIYAKCS